MCVVSFIGDHYSDTWKPYTVPTPSYPTTYPWNPTTYPWNPVPKTVIQLPDLRDELEKLRQEVNEMKELLKAAKRIDELTGQPDCQKDERVAVVRAVAEALGVDLEGLL